MATTARTWYTVGVLEPILAQRASATFATAIFVFINSIVFLPALLLSAVFSSALYSPTIRGRWLPLEDGFRATFFPSLCIPETMLTTFLFGSIEWLSKKSALLNRPMCFLVETINRMK